MSRFFDTEEGKSQKKLASHEIAENSFLLEASSTGLLEPLISQKAKKAQVTTTKQSNLPLKYDESKTLTENEIDGIGNQTMMDYYDRQIEEIYNYAASQRFFFPNIDYKRVHEVFKRAAIHGHPEGQYNLAMSYYLGDGCKKSLEKAAKWHTLALANGCKYSEYRLKQIIRKKSGDTCLLF